MSTATTGANHQFSLHLEWTGAEKGPVQNYDDYSRTSEIRIAGKPPLSLSAAAAFRGDPTVHNPEDLLIAALAGCHFLSYAALCARHQIKLVGYRDDAEGTMGYDKERKVMAFQQVTLRPRCTVVKGTDVEAAKRLHHQAHESCFIANSVNFPVTNEPVIEFAE